jgi:hypothetical protein
MVLAKIHRAAGLGILLSIGGKQSCAERNLQKIVNNINSVRIAGSESAI